MSKVRYGVIGIKGIGKRHILTALRNPNIELSALVDIDQERVTEEAGKLGVRAFTDYKAMLEADVVDAVSIATPHHLHAPMALTCLKAGLHVFVEKPLATRVSEADAILHAARSRNLKVCVGHQYRLHQLSQAMKQRIDDGTVGNVMRVLWTWVASRPQKYYERDVWRASWRQAGGGVLMNQVSHDLDLIRWMIGKPVQVSAMIGNQLHRSEVEDVACVNILFENGAFGTLQFTINQPNGFSVRQIAGENGTIVIQDVQSLDDDQTDYIRIGTYEDLRQSMTTTSPSSPYHPAVSWGSIKVAGDHSRLSKFARPRRLLRRLGVLRSDEASTAFTTLMESFIAAIRNGGEPIVNADNARPTVELINAIILSGMTKRTVDLPLDSGEYDRLFDEMSDGKTKVPTYH